MPATNPKAYTKKIKKKKSKKTSFPKQMAKVTKIMYG